MKYLSNGFLFLSFLSFLTISCTHKRDPISIIQNTINSIDKIAAISYDQIQLIGSTENLENAVTKNRKFYYERLISDSIIGAKAHIYFYDSSYVFLEDIYDGNKLIRKRNRDSSARVYNLIKYPDFKKKPFWGKTTPYVIQYMLKYAVENHDFYSIVMDQDTSINNRDCYRLKTVLAKKALMPGFHKFLNDTNRVETMILYIDKLNYYPQRIRMEVYFIDNPDNVYFTDNTFCNIVFNPDLNDSLFITSDHVIEGFKINEIKP